MVRDVVNIASCGADDIGPYILTRLFGTGCRASLSRQNTLADSANWQPEGLSIWAAMPTLEP
jgi:hypothetical protein